MFHGGGCLREYYLVDGVRAHPPDSGCNCATALSPLRRCLDVCKCFVPEFMGGSHHCRTAHSERQDVAYPSRFRHCGSNLTLCCVVLACHLLRRSPDNRLLEIDAPPGWYAIAWLLGRWFCGSDYVDDAAFALFTGRRCQQFEAAVGIKTISPPPPQNRISKESSQPEAEGVHVLDRQQQPVDLCVQDARRDCVSSQ
jgi:hypothetical protein